MHAPQWVVVYVASGLGCCCRLLKLGYTHLETMKTVTAIVLLAHMLQLSLAFAPSMPRSVRSATTMTMQSSDMSRRALLGGMLGGIGLAVSPSDARAATTLYFPKLEYSNPDAWPLFAYRDIKTLPDYLTGPKQASSFSRANPARPASPRLAILCSQTRR